MQKSKFYHAYRSLGNVERRQFSDFVHSPYFCKQPEVQALCAYLSQLPRNPSSESLDRERIFPILSPGAPFDLQRWRLWLSDLMVLLGKFIAQKAMEANPLLGQIYELRGCADRKLDRQFQYRLKKTRALIERSNPELPESPLHHFLLEATVNDYLRQNPRIADTHTLPRIKALDHFYLYEKLKSACTTLNNRNVVDHAHDTLFMDEILDHLSVQALPKHPILDIYRHVYLMFREADGLPHFHRVMSALDQHRSTLHREEIRDIYTFAQNYCIRRINEGHKNALAELFHIYQLLLDHGLLLDGGRLSPWHYKNIVAVGLRLGELQWVEEFIHGYQNQIAAAFRENAFTYNLAKLYYHQGAFTKVKRLLQQVDYEDVFYSLDSKTMLIKIFWEEREVEVLESFAASFLVYLRRNKLLSAGHRLRYANLVKHVRKLNRVREMGKARFREVAEGLENVEAVADSAWLRSVIARELEGA